MDWLNYHHLYYFSVIAEEGGVAPAARRLRLTHSTLSAQLKALERHFGAQLFDRRGKRLVLTPFGLDVASYAADIFRLGRELNDLPRGGAGTRQELLRVGIVPGLPKTLARHLLDPALARDHSALLVRQGSASELLEALAAGRLHMVLMNDVPTAPPSVRVHAHHLGETELELFARGQLVRRARRAFPSSLAGLPFVLPPHGAPLRRRLDVWFAKHDLRVEVKVEVEDAGLLRALGSGGHGIFPVRAALRGEIEDLHDVQLVGTCEGVREAYYAVSTERRIRHPGISAIVESARAGLRP